MKLLRLHIESFGKLSGFDMELSDGLNVLYKKNGWGKSTLAVFIKAMLYGLPATSKRSLDENERKKYTPWQGGAFGGSLDFETADGRFRVERFFGAKEAADTFALFDLKTGSPSTRYSAALGEELFGIDADGFERSTYLSQRLFDSGKENISISAKLGNLLDDVGDIGSYDLAMEALDKRRKYYILTGNRGAISDLDRTISERERELEACREKQQQMQAEEATLAGCNDAIKEKQQAAEQSRSRLQSAGLAREKKALLDQKADKEKELAALKSEKKQNDLFFASGTPTAAELDNARRLYNDIQEASWDLKEKSKPSPDRQRLAELRARYPQAVPTLALIDAAEEEVRILQALHQRRDTIQATLNANGPSHRFQNDLPTEEAIASAQKELSKAKSADQRLSSLAETKAKKPSPALPSLGVLCLLSGAAGLLLHPLLLLLSAVGVALLILWGIQSNRRKQASEKRLTEKENLTAERNRALQQVRAFLGRYGFPADSDPSQALTELQILCRQHRESREKLRGLLQEKSTVDQELQAAFNRICERLRPFAPSPAQLPELQSLLQRLRRDAELIGRLTEAERSRASARDQAEHLLQERKAALLPFLRRFDAAGRLRAGECLDLIGQKLADRERLAATITEKQNAIRRFVEEKQLENLTDAGDTGEFDRLTAEEAALRKEIEALQQQASLLHAKIDRLSQDADRVPELEALLKQLNDQLAESRTNAATIANTAKFLEEAKVALSTRYLDGMKQSFSRSYADLTGAETPDLLMDASFAVRLTEAGQARTMESFSRGRRDAVQFCVRLALADALYQDGEMPFLLLDDPFVNLDDDLLAAARNLLDSLANRYQILYLVCHKERV